MKWRTPAWVLMSVLPGAILLLWCLKPGVSGVYLEKKEALPVTRANTADSAIIASNPVQQVPGVARNLRLSNTSLSPGLLVRKEHAILLENALVDTESSSPLMIPEALRAGMAAGSYIVQSLKPGDPAFRGVLEQSGAVIVSYIPNNAFLVRASPAVAGGLTKDARVQAVLPFEPYYKLKASLLARLMEGGNENLEMRVLLFPDAAPPALAAQMGRRGAQVVQNGPLFEASPLGPVLRVQWDTAHLPELARMPEVQAVELCTRRVTACDLSRVVLGVATNSTTPENYLGLTGSNVLVSVNDTGVDATQAALAGRVVFYEPEGGVDTNGHGTHIAGIIAGNGSESCSVSNAPGSLLPAADLQFRGHAPQAKLFSIPVSLVSGSPNGDASLQQAAASTNALISNNSWLYAGDYDYDIAAASYDAAVRDALPSVSGSQPVLFVFAAGNEGAGGKASGTVLSPATAKNVITVGATELARLLTNQTWTCQGDGTNPPVCVTNQPWLSLTDSTNQVAAFSSRGNVGIGVEGESGRFKPDVVAPGCFVVSTRSSQWAESTYYTSTNLAHIPMPDANSIETFSNLNAGLGPFYRFETGSSVAAAGVSGVLALMQEFFEQRLGRTNSPALMKALLVNGARPSNPLYDLNTRSATNYQGWGMVNLRNSLPESLTNADAGTNAMFAFDQSPAEALATGQERTRFVSLSENAQSNPLRFTLVWTDPPANPLAGVKLVNDLNLVVTNLDTGGVFFGNDIPAGSNFNMPWDGTNSPALDRVNNVENVFLPPGTGTNYSVTVVARHVAVNAVNASASGVVQDYALVISSGDGEDPSALTLTDGASSQFEAGPAILLTNTFEEASGTFGAVLSGERIGANDPTLTNTISLPEIPNAILAPGSSNQWRFYVVTNELGYVNAAFLTYLPTPLSLERAVTAASPAPSDTNRHAADVDLYVTTNPALLSLDPAALTAADKSLNRGGDEAIVRGDAQVGPYYIGVKSECRRGADYGIAVIFSEQPFSQMDAQGRQSLRGVPVPALIPGGTPANPGEISIFCVGAQSNLVRRVVLTNTITHPNMAELTGTLYHARESVVLNHHSPALAATNQVLIYDDSGEGDIPGSQPTDGPGRLRDFAGLESSSPWRFVMQSTNQPGTNEAFWILTEPQSVLEPAIEVTVPPGALHEEFILVPLTATNLTVSASISSGTCPVTLQTGPANAAAEGCQTFTLFDGVTNVTLVFDQYSIPPITPGRYVLRLLNTGTEPVTVLLSAATATSAAPAAPTRIASTAPVLIQDDAITQASLEVTNSERIASMEIGVRLDHPRLSDLVLTLVNPDGQRVLLQENRGGQMGPGMGFDTLFTNLYQASFLNFGPQPDTNYLNAGASSGTLAIDYDFQTDYPDQMRVYYGSNLLFDSGMVTGSGSTNISYGPGASTEVIITMNELGNTNTDTGWYYTVTAFSQGPIRFTFTEDGQLAATPVKFAPPPFTNLTQAGVSFPWDAGIYYKPEESLDRFKGSRASGIWTLEIEDTRVGETSPAPTLLGWEMALEFSQEFPQPLALTHGEPKTVRVEPGRMQWFSVDVPAWSYSLSNALLGASLPLNLWFNPLQPPTGTNSGDALLLAASTNGNTILDTNSIPLLVPGTRCYLGVENTNSAWTEFTLAVSFEVTALEKGVTLAGELPQGPLPRYFYYDVSSNSAAVCFQLLNLDGNADIVASRDLPFPTPGSYSFGSFSAGTNPELIVMSPGSSLPISPGRWHIGVFNADTTNVHWTILANEIESGSTNIVIINQTNGSSGLCVSWLSIPGNLYHVQGAPAPGVTNWRTVSCTLSAIDYQTSFCLPPSPETGLLDVVSGPVINFTPPTISTVAWSTNGTLIEWSAPDCPEARYQVEFAPSLLPPVWTPFTNVIIPVGGSCSFLDDGAQSGGPGQERFYRLRQYAEP